MTTDEITLERAARGTGGAARFLRGVLAAQGFAVLGLALHGAGGLTALEASWSWATGIGGAMTGPLLVSIAALAWGASALLLARSGLVELRPRIQELARRCVRYSGGIAWLLGLLQTLISLYEVHGLFDPSLDYDEMLQRLGDVSARAYGSSVVGLGTFVVAHLLTLGLIGKADGEEP